MRAIVVRPLPGNAHMKLPENEPQQNGNMWERRKLFHDYFSFKILDCLTGGVQPEIHIVDTNRPP